MTKTVSKMQQRVNMSVSERDEAKAAEILRKAGEIPPNKYWDDANQAYIEINMSIDSANALLLHRVQSVMASPELRAKIKDEDEVASCLKLVTKDIQTCRAQLDAIQAKHAAHSGGVTTPEEIIEVMELNEQYRVTLCLYNDNVMPSVAHILELLGEDVGTMQAALTEQTQHADQLESLVPNHATDVNVITDVVAKEPTKV